MKKNKLIIALPVLLLLAACSKGPSDRDVESAFRKSIDQANQQIAQMAGTAASKEMQIVVKSVKNLGCNEAGSNAYTCDIESEMNSPMGNLKRSAPHRLVKGSDGWTVSQ